MSCTAGFKAGSNHLTSKFCGVCCTIGIRVPAGRVRALADDCKLSNGHGKSPWSAGGWRVVNNTTRCQGPQVVLFKHAPTAEEPFFVNMPAEMISTDEQGESFVHFAIKHGTLTPVDLRLEFLGSVRAPPVEYHRGLHAAAPSTAGAGATSCSKRLRESPACHDGLCDSLRDASSSSDSGGDGRRSNGGLEEGGLPKSAPSAASSSSRPLAWGPRASLESPTEGATEGARTVDVDARTIDVQPSPPLPTPVPCFQPRPAPAAMLSGTAAPVATNDPTLPASYQHASPALDWLGVQLSLAWSPALDWQALQANDVAAAVVVTAVQFIDPALIPSFLRQANQAAAAAAAAAPSTSAVATPAATASAAGGSAGIDAWIDECLVHMPPSPPTSPPFGIAGHPLNDSAIGSTCHRVPVATRGGPAATNGRAAADEVEATPAPLASPAARHMIRGLSSVQIAVLVIASVSSAAFATRWHTSAVAVLDNASTVSMWAVAFIGPILLLRVAFSISTADGSASGAGDAPRLWSAILLLLPLGSAVRERGI